MLILQFSLLHIKNTIVEAYKKGFFNLLSANILIQIFAFGTQLFVAHILIPEDLGRIKILQLFLSVFTIIGGIGLSNSTIKLCSENRTDEEKKELFKAGIIFTIFSTTLVYAISVLLNFFGVFSKDQFIKLLFPLAMFPLISGSLFNIYLAYFISQKKVKVISNLTIVNRILAIVGIILLTYLLGVRGYYYALNISYLVMLIFCVYKFTLKDQLWSAGFKNHLKDLFTTHWKFGRPSLFTSIFSEISAYSDLIFLNFFVKDLFEIGHYGFALTLLIALRVLPGTVQQISSPYFSTIGEDKSTVNKFFKKYSKILLLIIVLSFIAFIILVPWGINNFFIKYQHSIQYLIPLSIAWSIKQYSHIVLAALFGMGKLNYISISYFISFLGNILIIPFAWYYKGVVGIAWSIILSSILTISIQIYFYRKSIEAV